MQDRTPDIDSAISVLLGALAKDSPSPSEQKQILSAALSLGVGALKDLNSIANTLDVLQDTVRQLVLLEETKQQAIAQKDARALRAYLEDKGPDLGKVL